MHALIARLSANFSNKILDEKTDAAELRIGSERLAFTTDSYVVKPVFFPGGDIGSLAVFGTVNDLAMKGATPLFISLSLILEEGLEISTLDRIAVSIKKAAEKSGVQVVTGDIKVVEKGSVDKIFINTSGVGSLAYPGRLGLRAKAHDAVLINGGIAEHGMAIFQAREKFGFISKVKSDSRPLNRDVARCLSRSKKVTFLRDVTRGGLATTLNEIAASSNLGIDVYEKDIPVRKDVRKMCDCLGFDPLYIPCEGRFLCCVSSEDALKVKQALGPQARIIGKVVPAHKREVRLHTALGVPRLLPMLEQDQLPRIC